MTPSPIPNTGDTFMRFLAVLALTLSGSVAQAKLELRDVQASHGQFGPVRKSNEYVAGDQVYFRYSAAGVRTDDAGRVRGELRMKLTDAKGKVLLNTENALEQTLALGGDTLTGYAALNVARDFAPGEYELTVEFADLLSKEVASFRQKFTVKAPEFALLRVRFSYDKAGAAAAPVGGTVGQTLFVRMNAVEFDRSKGEIDVEMRIEILDAAGKPTTPKPIRATVHNEKPAEVKEIDTLNLSGVLTLNRPGEFLLRITVTDTITKKKVTFDAPLKVTAP
jgi:hypothetical protein